MRAHNVLCYVVGDAYIMGLAFSGAGPLRLSSHKVLPAFRGEQNK